MKTSIAATLAAFVLAAPAWAQNSGTVSNHAFAIGKGPGVQGLSSLACAAGQIPIGQVSGDPLCIAPSGDLTMGAGGFFAIGAGKVVSADLGADVFSTAHSWSGQQTFTAPVLGTPASGTLTNATGLPVGTGISGLGTGVATFLAVPNSANLRAAITDEVGTGAAYFVGGALGTPASATLTNATGLPVGGIASVAANTVVSNATGSAASPTAVAMPSCSGANQAINWTSGTGPGCVTIAGGGGGVTSVNGNTGAVTTGNAPPGGRLGIAQASPSSGVCNPTTDIVGAAFVYYMPCVSPFVPIYNGTSVQAYNFTSSATDSVGLILALGSNWTAATIYDVYVTLNGGSPVLCTVAWSSSVIGSGTRATTLATYSGMLTNSAAIAACRTNNTTTIGVSQYQGTYLGSFFIHGASAGQIDLKFGTLAAGGGPAVSGIWNTYNQLPSVFVVQDSTSSWSTSAISVYQPLNASGSNSITFVTGNGATPIEATINLPVSSALAGTPMQVGFGLNSSSTLWSRCSPGFSASTSIASITATCKGYVPTGLNQVTAVQYSGSNSSIFYGQASPSLESSEFVWWW